MLVAAAPSEALAVIGAMRAVATADGCDALTPADAASLAAVWRHVLGHAEALAPERVPRDRAAIVAALRGRLAAEFALRFCAVSALVDGKIDAAKIAVVDAFASELGLATDYVPELDATVEGRWSWVIAEMLRRNVASIRGLKWDPAHVDEIFLPYDKGRTDPGLTARYRALEKLPAGTLGRTFYEHYHVNGYALPGEAHALNERFATPHDSTHVLSGYSTSAQGELLVSTFTGAMHKIEGMAGHILPVIYSWHLGVRFSNVVDPAVGALDPEKFWVAWARGHATAFDVFGPEYDFWAVVETPLEELRARYAIAPLEAPYAAAGDRVSDREPAK
jgi:hypothetical protein